MEPPLVFGPDPIPVAAYPADKDTKPLHTITLKVYHPTSAVVKIFRADNTKCCALTSPFPKNPQSIEGLPPGPGQWPGT